MFWNRTSAPVSPKQPSHLLSLVIANKSSDNGRISECRQLSFKLAPRYFIGVAIHTQSCTMLRWLSWLFFWLAFVCASSNIPCVLSRRMLGKRSVVDWGDLEMWSIINAKCTEVVSRFEKISSLQIELNHHNYMVWECNLIQKYIV